MKNQVVLVTGGTGSIGRAFVKLACEEGAAAVIVYSRDEAKQARMEVEFRQYESQVLFAIGDVRDAERLKYSLLGVDLVVHAAAMKRVDSCELNANEAYATNVEGSLNVLRACRGHAILLSTDKAVYPRSVYGTTKLAAEQLWTRWQGCETSVLRGGNVLGSTGSVLARWREDLAFGRSSVVTNPDATRFWTTAEHMAGCIGWIARKLVGNGRIVVPMLRGASLGDLALAVGIGADRWTESRGLRRGEKMHEHLIAGHEMPDVEVGEDAYIIDPSSKPVEGVALDFICRSDLAPRLTVDALRAMIS